MNPLAKYLIAAGAFIIIAGVILYFFPNAFRWVGRLPGDIRIEKDNSRFYFPIVSMILISIFITVLFNFIKKMM